MTRFVHDQLAKQYLAELLSPLGEVETSRDVPGEVRQIDIWFAPKPQLAASAKALGLLGRLAASPCIFEPFRNAVTPTEVRDCLLKLFELHGELQRQSRREESRLCEEDLPRLWILSPTASESLLYGFRARLDEQDWVRGVYFLGDAFRSAIVAIHQLPRTSDTLWLRILGKGTVQKQAIEELTALPKGNPLRSNVLELLTNWTMNIESKTTLTSEEREFLQNLTPAYLEWRKEAVREGQRFVVENLLRFRFGELDEELSAIIKPLLELPPEEFMPPLMQLSREELLTRFGE